MKNPTSQSLPDGRPDPRIDPFWWRYYQDYGWFPCPGAKRKSPDYRCGKWECYCGLKCEHMAARGLDGDGKPLPKSERPRCGAKIRQGGLCAVRVVPGKMRCRLHGGLSTGPRTQEGRAKLSASLADRWKVFKQRLTDLEAQQAAEQPEQRSSRCSELRRYRRQNKTSF
ncbi:HGGxSTG domain-containing protein [Mesorhizobium liriopis]|uniref:HGGxSTG domain-containing protein n=1 Tax=Mesorhizobium liriopis TaxID=2953882 RepID=UPI00339047D5